MTTTQISLTAKLVAQLLTLTLTEIRDFSETRDQNELEMYFLELQQGRDRWLADREEGRWSDMPKLEVNRPNILAQLMGFRRPTKS